jgi:hypothetical protein
MKGGGGPVPQRLRGRPVELNNKGARTRKQRDVEDRLCFNALQTANGFIMDDPFLLCEKSLIEHEPKHR